jgi:hypothetical protein
VKSKAKSVFQKSPSVNPETKDLKAHPYLLKSYQSTPTSTPTEHKDQVQDENDEEEQDALAAKSPVPIEAAKSPLPTRPAKPVESKSPVAVEAIKPSPAEPPKDFKIIETEIKATQESIATAVKIMKEAQYRMTTLQKEVDLLKKKD